MIGSETVNDRLWNKIPDGIAFRMSTKTKTGVICLLEFKHMSDVTSHYKVRTKRVGESQYVSLRSALSITMQRQGWKVEQVSFISGTVVQRGGAQDKLNLFRGSPRNPVSIEPILVKLAMKIFDEYANILKGMYSIRCNGRSDHGDTIAHPPHSLVVTSGLTSA